MPIYKTDKKDKEGLAIYRVRVNYTDAFGKAKQLTRIAHGLQAAKDLEAKLSQSSNGTEASITLNELYADYIEYKRHNLRASSVDKSERILNGHVLPELGKYRLNKLNVKVLTKWKHNLDDKPLKTVTKQNIFGEFRSLLNWAVKMEYMPGHSLNKVGNFRDAYQQKKNVDFYTPEEFKLFIAEARKKADISGYYDYYVFFCIAFYTGARKGEINALTWNDIEGNVMHITKSVNQKLRGTKNMITPPKNASSVRDVQLPQPLVDVLSEHYARGKQYKDFNDNMFVCGGIEPVRDSSLSKESFEYSKAAGVKHIRIHDFRHSHASLLIHHGVNILEISKRLGHSNIERTLNTYAHLYPAEADKAVAILNEIRM